MEIVSHLSRNNYQDSVSWSNWSSLVHDEFWLSRIHANDLWLLRLACRCGWSKWHAHLYWWTTHCLHLLLVRKWVEQISYLQHIQHGWSKARTRSILKKNAIAPYQEAHSTQRQNVQTWHQLTTGKSSESHLQRVRPSKVHKKAEDVWDCTEIVVF